MNPLDWVVISKACLLLFNLLSIPTVSSSTMVPIKSVGILTVLNIGKCPLQLFQLLLGKPPLNTDSSSSLIWLWAVVSLPPLAVVQHHLLHLVVTLLSITLLSTPKVALVPALPKPPPAPLLLVVAAALAPVGLVLALVVQLATILANTLASVAPHYVPLATNFAVSIRSKIDYKKNKRIVFSY